MLVTVALNEATGIALTRLGIITRKGKDGSTAPNNNINDDYDRNKFNNDGNGNNNNNAI